MRLLDLFCKAGGAAMGYHQAGFEVVGVDLEPQSRYPFEFVQADALEYLASYARRFDAVHASPPCQAFVPLSRLRAAVDHSDLIPETRRLLEASGLPYVIENVPAAPLLDPVQICGGGLGLEVRRHRAFECSFPLLGVPCRHVWRAGRPVGVYGSTGGWSNRNRQRGWSVAEWREAMGIDWMTGRELAQAIPPAYTTHIGRQLLKVLAETHKEAA